MRTAVTGAGGQYAYSTMFASIREQRWAAVSDEVRRLTGCLPVAVRETLASYKAA